MADDELVEGELEATNTPTEPDAAPGSPQLLPGGGDAPGIADQTAVCSDPMSMPSSSALVLPPR